MNKPTNDLCDSKGVGGSKAQGKGRKVRDGMTGGRGSKAQGKGCRKVRDGMTGGRGL